MNKAAIKEITRSRWIVLKPFLFAVKLKNKSKHEVNQLPTIQKPLDSRLPGKPAFVPTVATWCQEVPLDTILTLALPESIMETCNVVLTFESIDEILWCEHSNETSLAVLLHSTICFHFFIKMKFGIFLEF